MIDIESVKTEMYRRGYNKAQVESKVMLGVYEILSGSEFGSAEEMYKLETAIKVRQVDQINLERRCNELRREMQALKESINQQQSETQKYLESMMRSLEECETKEGRDALKAAQMFVNSVNVDTKYDNTAFIIGLSAILSKGDVAPIESLRKINPKEFEHQGPSTTWRRRI